MIVAEQKPVETIIKMLPEDCRLLVVGCGTCVTVCMAGGEKEVKMLCSALRMTDKKYKDVTDATIERQCDKEFVSEIKAEVEKSDVILSMACGVGVQMMSDFYTGKQVFPALNTLFMGSNEAAGYWLERCLGCGDCVLDITGGVCPRVRCSKSLMNGPCGGSQDGKCEVDPNNLECGWNLIYNRLKELDKVDCMLKIQPPQNWSSSHHGGPRRLIREDVYTGE